MEVLIQETRDDAETLATRLVADAVQVKPDIVLGLATGQTMERVYAKLVACHQNGQLDFSECRTFNLDEYISLSPDNEHSYRHFMNQHLFDHINIDIANTHIPDGVAEDLDAECADYEAAIGACGGIDLQLLGIGSSGHIGFNEPLSALRSRTRCKALTPETIEQNSGYFPSPDMMPRRAITMGVGTILDSRRCILLATGEHKADVLAKAIEGPITSMISASALQWHPHCTVIVDEAAASGLTEQDYYRWIWENEPEWQMFHDVPGV